MLSTLVKDINGVEIKAGDTVRIWGRDGGIYRLVHSPSKEDATPEQLADTSCYTYGVVKYDTGRCGFVIDIGTDKYRENSFYDYYGLADFKWPELEIIKKE